MNHQDRNPTLERKDLEKILRLLDNVDSGSFESLRKKIDESMSVYREEDRIIEEAQYRVRAWREEKARQDEEIRKHGIMKWMKPENS
jgi:hypothetical protein